MSYNNRDNDNRRDGRRDDRRGYDDRRNNYDRHDDRNGSQYGGSQYGSSNNPNYNGGDRNYDGRDNNQGGGYRNGGSRDNQYGHHGGHDAHYNQGRDSYDHGYSNQGRDNYSSHGRDNLSDRFNQVNIGGTSRGASENNTYTRPRPSVSRVPRGINDVRQMGDLAGSAQYPNMPVAKKELAHNMQEFARRPDGWVFDKKAVGTKTELITNHALVHLPENTIKLYCYNIEVFQNKKLLTKREEASPLFHDLVRRNGRCFPNSSDFIFNDVNFLWTTSQLQQAEGRVGDGRTYMRWTYTSRVDFGRVIREDQDKQLLSTLVHAIATQRARSPGCRKYIVFKRCMFMINDVEEARDEVMDSPITVMLGQGVDARLGVSIGIKLNLRAGVTACYDVTHTMFTRTGYPLIRLLCELINHGTITDQEFEEVWDERLRNATVTYDNRRELDRILRKMRLRYSHDTAITINADGTEIVRSVLRHTGSAKKEFKYYELTPGSARDTMFTDQEGRTISIAEYFLRFQNIRLRYPNLPCFVKKPSKMNKKFIAWPMEFISYIAEPKRFEGQTSEAVKADFIEYTTYTAPQRLALLQHVFEQKSIADVPAAVDNQDSYMRNHGLTIEKEMLSVKATVLPPPTVVYGEGSTFKDTEHLGEWEAVTHDPIRKVLEGAAYVRNTDPDAPKKTKRIIGSILTINSPVNGKAEMHYDPACYHRLMKAIEDCGQPVAWENREYGQAAIQGVHSYCQGVDQPGTIYEFFQNLKNNIDEKKYKKCDEEVLIPFVLVIFEVKCSTLTNFQMEYGNDYNFVKYLGDNELGIFTQGILLKNLSVIQEVPAACKLTRLMVEKILGKVGTTHRKLDREGGHKSWTKLTDPKSPTLVLGVDVCHPSPRERMEQDVRKLSVAAIVGSIDIDCTEYRASTRIQYSGEEMIVRFRDEILARINAFILNNNGIRPAHIVVYRDGLCEGDFQRILYEERMDIEKCCIEIDKTYQPTITYIVVSKRHHTRFFLKDDSEGHASQGLNILPGTLVEDTVTTTNYYDFFLSTQVGQKGVARPTHYYVLYDTWKPFVSFWPTVTHALTYMFCRATSTVSLPAPVIYAHLAAKRAKECLDGAWNVARMRNLRISVDNCHDVNELTKQINVNNGLDGMTFV